MEDVDADPFPSALIVVHGGLAVPGNEDQLAEQLQLQEVLIVSIPKPFPPTDDNDEARSGDNDSREEEVAEKDDPKGKRVVVMELEESSNARNEHDDGFFCVICMESKPSVEGFSIKSCNHEFCSDCIMQYIAAKLEELNMTSIGCPDPDCKDGILKLEECREILPQVVFDRWSLALCESAIGTKKFYCPYNDCSALLIVDDYDGNGDPMRDAECPHCSRLCCAQCKVPWHTEISCEAFQQLGDDEKGREDLMLRKMAIDSKWQRCPKCNIYVEKIEGCVFVKCRCGYCFCYECASPMSMENHFCKKCQKTW